MGKIFITCIIQKDGSVIGMAVAENGVILAEVLCPNTYSALHKLGIDSDNFHDVYRNHYPHGYGLEIVDSIEKHQGIRSAFQRAINEFHAGRRILSDVLTF